MASSTNSNPEEVETAIFAVRNSRSSVSPRRRKADAVCTIPTGAREEWNP